MHLIEDLVADSVRLLDAHYPAGDPRPRDWFAALYRFQEQFDCSFTHFRVMDILLRRRYAYRFALEQHPDYAERRVYFDSLTEFTGLRVFDEESGDFDGYDSWLEDGYVDPPFLYCDAGSALWRRMASHHLTGPDTSPPRRVTMLDMLHAIAIAAEAGDPPLLADWYDLGPGTFGVLDAGEPVAEAVREIVLRTGALDGASAHGFRPPPEVIAEDELDSWWWGAAEAGSSIFNL